MLCGVARRGVAWRGVVAARSRAAPVHTRTTLPRPAPPRPWECNHCHFTYVSGEWRAVRLGSDGWTRLPISSSRPAGGAVAISPRELYWQHVHRASCMEEGFQLAVIALAPYGQRTPSFL